MAEDVFTFNPNNPDEIQRLINEYGDNKAVFNGKNGNDKDVTISICHEKVAISTCQHNGWMRKDVFYANGAHEIEFERRK